MTEVTPDPIHSRPSVGTVRASRVSAEQASTALEQLREYEGIALVDLDETLYLRNSTEDFLDSVRPRHLGLVALRLLDVLRPWRFTGGEATRDVWRVQLLVVLFPWTLLVWPHRVRALARDHVNRPLWRALVERRGPAAMVTVGFRFIVTPLVRALGVGSLPIVASRITSYADRRKGKLAMAMEALGESRVAGALVLTDSMSDGPLLERCACPLRVVWPAARYVPAFSATYLPGQYVSRIKRPGERYILRAILQEDFAFWVLASVGFARQPLFHVVGVALLLLSFWAIYERGYVDNDLVAARFEENPKLSDAFRTTPVATPAVQPWIWSLGAGAAAVLVLGWPAPFSVPRFGAWVGVLVATLLWFRLYNRFDKSTRAWMYLPLRVARSAAFMALLAVSMIGVIALAAHSLTRWVHYCIYRLGRSDWPRLQADLMRLCFFLVLGTLVAIADGVAAVATWTGLALLAWNLYRARSEIAQQWRAASRIDA